MSDDVEKLLASNTQKEQEMDEYFRKKQEIQKHDVDVKHSRLQESYKQKELFQAVDLKEINHNYLKEIQENGAEYLQNVKNCGRFLNDSFDHKVPAFGKNIITIVGKSGNGKSTTTANIALQYLAQNKKVLVISNEEIAFDCYNRVTGLIRGFPYTDHANFTEHQIETFKEYVGILSQRMTVIDDNYTGEIGCTSTIEGIKSLFTNIIENKIHYDVIIIDYYQNICESIDEPHANIYDIQAMFCKYIDKMKNLLPNTAIYILAQQKDNVDGSISFKESIEGSKKIYNVSTCVIEMVAKYDKLMTEWTIRKSRFNESIGETIRTGFKRGAYVKNDDEFAHYIQQLEQRKITQRALSNIGNKTDSDESTD
jgi:ABC-type dipeptide/oligopeptide/nickel transport system ATPase component